MRKRYLLTVIATAVGVLLVAAVSLGQTVTVNDGDWHTVDGGGGVSTGNMFTIRGTAGQPDAGVSSGAIYTVKGGFWGGVTTEHIVYLPLVLRGY